MEKTLKLKRAIPAKKLEQIRRQFELLRLERGMIGGTTKTDAMDENINGVPLQACIDIERWGALLQMNVLWSPKRPCIREFSTNVGISDPIEATALAAGDHEIGHWKRCPKSLVMHTDIQDSIAQQLERQGKKSKSLAKHLTNCFEDIIDNTAIRREHNEHALSIFYSETGPFTTFFAAYMLVQMEVWGDKNDRELLKHNFAKLTQEEREQAEQAAANVIKGWGIKGKKQDEMQLALLQEEYWVSMGAVFARYTCDLVKMVKSGSQPKNKQNGSGSGQGQEGDSQSQDESEESDGDGSQSKNGKGKGKGQKQEQDKEDGEGNGSNGKGKDSEEKGENKEGKGNGSGQKEDEDEVDGEAGNDVVDDSDEYDPSDKADGSKEDDEVVEKDGPGGKSFDKALEGEKGKKEVLRERMNRAQKGAGKGAGAAGIPKLMEADEAVEYIYEIMSPEIPIKAEQVEEGVSLPVIKYTREEFDPEIHDASDVFGVMLGEKGNVALGAYKNKFNIDFPLMKDLQGFPNVMWVVDTSGSMFWGGKSNPLLDWPEDCGYHFAIMGAIGTRKWLAREQILSYIKMQMVTFSDRTYASGWRGFEEGDAIKRALFKHQKGGTELDPNVLCPQLDQSSPALIILLSDGAITNWHGQDSARIMSSLARHQVFMVNIGGCSTQTASDLRDAGMAVADVTNYEEMSRLMVDAAAKTFNAIREKQNLWNY